MPANGFLVWAQSVVAELGYPGIFLVNLIGSASIILPVPSFVVTFAFGAILNPWLVGIAAGTGAAIGELTGYALGFGSREMIEKRHRKWFERTKRWVESWGIFPVIALFAATPLPDDIRKFFLAVLIGKVVMSLALAWGGFYGLQWVLQTFGGI